MVTLEATHPCGGNTFLNERKRCIHAVQRYRKPPNGLACAPPGTPQCCRGAPVSLPVGSFTEFQRCVCHTSVTHPSMRQHGQYPASQHTVKRAARCLAFQAWTSLSEQLFLTLPAGCAKRCENPGGASRQESGLPLLLSAQLQPSITFFSPPSSPIQAPGSPAAAGLSVEGQGPLSGE